MPDMFKVFGLDAIDLLDVLHMGHDIGILDGDGIAELAIDLWGRRFPTLGTT